MTDWKGRTLEGYVVDVLLGKGGMGEVYRAFDPKLQRTVALKVLSEEAARDRDFAARFEREARAASALSHQNIAHVYATGRVEGRPYYVMEYVDGGSLADALDVAGRVPGVKCLDYLAQAAEGLRCAHEVGIVHRDVKPENLMLDAKGRVKIVDFGLARRIAGDVSITKSSMVVGTPRYMSPEQATGEDVDHRSDIYSLGATFYHLLTGEPPFDAPTPVALLMKHVRDAVPPLRAKLPSVPEAVARIVERMLAKRPEDRYQTYDDLLADIRLVKEGRFREVAARQPAARAVEPAPQRDRSWVLPAAAIVVLVLGFVGFLGWKGLGFAKDVAKEVEAEKANAPAPGAAFPASAAALVETPAPIPANWNVGYIQAALHAKTVANLKRVSMACQVYLAEHDDAPPDLDTVVRRHELAPEEQRDGWARLLRYEKLSRAKFRVSSGGPDGRFGNADDVVMEDGFLTQGEGPSIPGVPSLAQQRGLAPPPPTAPAAEDGGPQQ